MENITAVYPGTFDPITNGHLDIIERASALFSKVIVTVAVNTSKAPLFTKDERKDMIENVTSGFDNVEVDAFDGLLVDLAKKNKPLLLLEACVLYQISNMNFKCL